MHFERLMGKKNAERMLGKHNFPTEALFHVNIPYLSFVGQEGWIPTAAEAKEAGLIQEVVPHERLGQRAQEVAEQWIKEGRERWMRKEGKVGQVII